MLFVIEMKISNLELNKVQHEDFEDHSKKIARLKIDRDKLRAIREKNYLICFKIISIYLIDIPCVE